MKFRNDIVGLRAIAVLPVVIYHISQSYMPGGYVGVDVFFVISGYLIGANILDELRIGKFNILNFYAKRVRRIFPAYAFMILIVSIVIFLRFFPSETQNFAATLIASITSVSNIYFWATTNYFSVSAEEIPLIHTWSLSVEEQFYILFPILLMLTFRYWRKSWKAIIFAAFLVSLIACIVSVYSHPDAAFYLPWSRAWELLLGVMLTFGNGPTLERRQERDVAMAVGLLGICIPMVFYRPYTVFPGISALPPTLGTAICLYVGARGRSIFTPLLTCRPMVFFGLISYSLYLWHWPLLVFQRTEFFLAGSGMRVIDRAAILFASIACATISWAFVERPTRNSSVLPLRPLMIGFLGTMSLLLVIGVSAILCQGFPGRFSEDTQKVAKYLDYDSDRQFRAGTCFLAREDGFEKFDRLNCLPNKPGRPTYMIFGDSHAAALSYGLREVGEANILQVTGVGCPAILVLQDASSGACSGLIDLAINQMPKTRHIDRVFLVSRWNLGRVGRGPGWNATWLSELGQTLEAFRKQGIPVTIIGPMPEYQVRLPRILARSLESGDPTLPQRYIQPETLALDGILRSFALQRDTNYISVADLICKDGRCETFGAPLIPLLFDTDHATDAGSLFLAKLIFKNLALTPPTVSAVIQ